MYSLQFSIKFQNVGLKFTLNLIYLDPIHRHNLKYEKFPINIDFLLKDINCLTKLD